MSWLSSLFGGGGEDPLAVQQRIEGQRRLDAEAAQRAEQQQLQMQLDYLNSLRADQAAKDAALAAKDPTALRQSAQHTLEGVFSPEFESSYVPGTTFDPLAAEAYNTQRASAEDYINRLFKRGVITDTGRTAAVGNLDTQSPAVRQQLKDLGSTLIESERGKLGGIADKARQRASSLEVGDTFDLTPYQNELNTEIGSFQGGLSDLYKSQIPTDLFDTSTLASIAGGAQGAGNTPFDPSITPTTGATTSTETDPFANKQVAQKRTTSVF